jgi:hypothetical protein
MFDHPEVLPLAEIEGAFTELISVCREMPAASGPIDNLFITADGHIVIAVVVLIIGDGIREGTEQLVDVLQSHAGFHFTFALR